MQNVKRIEKRTPPSFLGINVQGKSVAAVLMRLSKNLGCDILSFVVKLESVPQAAYSALYYKELRFKLRDVVRVVKTSLLHGTKRSHSKNNHTIKLYKKASRMNHRKREALYSLLPTYRISVIFLLPKQSACSSNKLSSNRYNCSLLPNLVR